MRGKYPVEYFENPDINKPIQEIWDDIERFTLEILNDEPNNFHLLKFIVLIPPFKYKNKFIKGAFYSQGLDVILELYPQLKNIFFCGAISMWSSYPWTKNADFYLACYENKQRENYYKEKYKEKKDITFIPLQDVDFTNENLFVPSISPKRNIDVICVSTLYPVKNLTILAKAAKIYEHKYKEPLRITFVLGSNEIKKDTNGNLNFSNCTNTDNVKIFNSISEILGDSIKYMNFIPWAEYKDLIHLYANSKCCVLCSLFEGKNRSIFEAMACNTPIVVFKQYNQYSRGNFPIFRGNSGETVSVFSPECLADTIHKVIKNPTNYEPRENYCKYYGRKNFIKTLINYIPYYKENIPDLKDNDIINNTWIDLACFANYKLSYYDFLYSRNPLVQNAEGLKSIEYAVNIYKTLFKEYYYSNC